MQPPRIILLATVYFQISRFNNSENKWQNSYSSCSAAYCKDFSPEPVQEISCQSNYKNCNYKRHEQRKGLSSECCSMGTKTLNPQLALNPSPMAMAITILLSIVQWHFSKDGSV